MPENQEQYGKDVSFQYHFGRQDLEEILLPLGIKLELSICRGEYYFCLGGKAYEFEHKNEEGFPSPNPEDDYTLSSDFSLSVGGKEILHSSRCTYSHVIRGEPYHISEDTTIFRIDDFAYRIIDWMQRRISLEHKSDNQAADDSMKRDCKKMRFPMPYKDMRKEIKALVDISVNVEGMCSHIRCVDESIETSHSSDFPGVRDVSYQGRDYHVLMVAPEDIICLESNIRSKDICVLSLDNNPLIISEKTQRLDLSLPWDDSMYPYDEMTYILSLKDDLAVKIFTRMWDDAGMRMPPY